MVNKTNWEPVVGYDGNYLISTHGAVYSVPRNRIDGREYKGRFLKSFISKNTGYLQVGLYKNGNYKRWTIHKLVAWTFIENKKNLPQVNHKDGDKLNNDISNLEWCTAAYNVKDGFNRGRVAWNKGKKKKRKSKICLWCKEKFTVKRKEQVLCSVICTSYHNGNKPKYLKKNGLLEEQ